MVVSMSRARAVFFIKASIFKKLTDIHNSVAHSGTELANKEAVWGDVITPLCGWPVF